MGRHIVGDAAPDPVDGAPVFVDEAGRRRRALSIAGLGLAAVLVITLAAIGVAFAGGGTAALPSLPGLSKQHHPGTGHVPAASPSAGPGATPDVQPTVPSGPNASPSSPGVAQSTSAKGLPSPTSTHPNNGHGSTVRPSHGPKN